MESTYKVGSIFIVESLAVSETLDVGLLAPARV
jgi:hypothetical protein